MQEASVTGREVQIHEALASIVASSFLFALRSALVGRTRSGISRNQGSGRKFVFVTEFVFALPFSLTLHAFVAEDPDGVRNHQFERLSRRNVPRLYLI